MENIRIFCWLLLALFLVLCLVSVVLHQAAPIGQIVRVPDGRIGMVVDAGLFGRIEVNVLARLDEGPEWLRSTEARKQHGTPRAWVTCFLWEVKKVENQ